MSYDTRIPMMGNAFNLMGSINAGLQTGQMHNEINTQNALRNLFETQGAGILQGDQNALSALAGIDPMAALDVQGTHLSQQATREQMQQRRAAAARAAQSHAASLSQQQRAEQAAEIERTLQQASYLYQQGDEARYNQLLIENEMDPSEYPFADFPMVAATLDGVREALEFHEERAAGPEADLVNVGGVLYDRSAYDGTPGSLVPLTEPRTEPGSSISLPDGTQINLNGGAIPDLGLTEGEGRNAGFALRAGNSHQIINELEQQGTEFGSRLLNNAPLGLGNYAVSPEFQRFSQAERDFINAVLRRESGAVISEEEFANARQQYFPQPGDSPEVIAQKRRNREDAIRAMQLSAGPAAPLVSQPPAQDPLGIQPNGNDPLGLR